MRRTCEVDGKADDAMEYGRNFEDAGLEKL